MKQVWKRRAVVGSVLLLVCVSVYLNWRYTDKAKESSKVLGESQLVSAQGSGTQSDTETTAAGDSDYFATARLNRKQARDNAIGLLDDAKADETADDATKNKASETLQVLASYTVAESQIESLVTAKGYTDCVAFMGDDGISVVVGDSDGLDATDVAKIKDIVVDETSYQVDQIKIMEAN
ncbi:MAG: SpoIIIAH-like family protein [Clostridiales bacterium]|nr:SpoIIIAH-like family protein [Clostridiales bacterium]